MSNKYYGTHEEAIDELIEVNDGNIGLISKNENYRDLFKLSLIKVWFGGALCYFVMWGLSLYVSNDLDMFVLLSFVLAISTDFLLNPVLKYLYSKDNLYSKYIMVNIEYKKKVVVRRKRIRETSLGFKTLEYKLPIWIEESLKKIKNK